MRDDGKAIFEVHLYRPEATSQTYSEVHWHGMIRMDPEEREDLVNRCQLLQGCGELTTFSIKQIPPAITIADLRENLPAKFRDMLGFGAWPNGKGMSNYFVKGKE